MCNCEDDEILYLRDLPRDERNLICRYRIMSEAGKRKLNEELSKLLEENPQSIARGERWTSVK